MIFLFAGIIFRVGRDHNHKRGKTMKAIKARGDFDSACNHAIAYANRHNRGLEGAEEFLRRAGWGAQTRGIEYASCAGRELSYLNTGEAYDLTIGQEDGGELFSTSWGGWFEDEESAHCEEERVVRCVYCSAFTPIEGGTGWHYTVCESCGRYVDSCELPEKENEEEGG